MSTGTTRPGSTAADPNEGRALGNGWLLDPPDLIIQDEQHLIAGPLGTVAALYETAIDRLASRWIGERRVRPKVVASTATVRRAADQIKALFDREATHVFPPPGLDRTDSFFARTVPSSQDAARLISGSPRRGAGQSSCSCARSRPSSRPRRRPATRPHPRAGRTRPTRT